MILQQSRAIACKIQGANWSLTVINVNNLDLSGEGLAAIRQCVGDTLRAVSSDTLRHGHFLGGDFNFLSRQDAPRSRVTGMLVTKRCGKARRQRESSGIFSLLLAMDIDEETHHSKMACTSLDVRGQVLHDTVELDKAGISDHAQVCCMDSMTQQAQCSDERCTSTHLQRPKIPRHF